MPLKIVFMGTPEFAVPALKSLLPSKHEVVAVYSQPPRPAGRGQQLRQSPVHAEALTHKLPVETPVNFKLPETVEKLKSYGADIAVVAAYGLLLPKSVLEAFPKGCINIHPSLLPRWRGAAPIHRTVLAGDHETAVCIMQMEEGLDTGPVLITERMTLPDGIITGVLHNILAEKSVPLLLQALEEIDTGKVIAKPQSEDGVTYAKKITKEEARIDWSKPAVEIDRLIRGLNPYPVAVTELNGEPIKIWGALVVPEPEQMRNALPGTVLDDVFTIACGNETALRPTMIQRAGKKPMTTEDVLRGFSIEPGTRLV